jgi:hypothetical protein
MAGAPLQGEGDQATSRARMASELRPVKTRPGCRQPSSPKLPMTGDPTGCDAPYSSTPPSDARVGAGQVTYRLNPDPQRCQALPVLDKAPSFS